jgi:hypothetical protein
MSVNFSLAQSIQNINGKWKDIKLPYQYEFTKTSAKFTQSGYPVFMDYQIDSTKTPIWIDFTIKQGGQTMKIPGLMKWKTKDTLWIQQFPPFSKHPTEFAKDSTSNARKIHILVRRKE